MDLFKTPTARELFLPEPTFRESAGKMVVASLRRRRRMLAICTGVGLAIGLLYLMCASRVLTTSSSVRVAVADLSQPGMEATAGGLLAEQPQVMCSTPVVALAISSPGIHELSVFRGKPSRIDFVQQNLTVHSSGESGVYELTLTSNKPGDAQKILDALVAAYIQFASSPPAGTTAPAAKLQEQQQKVDKDLAAAQTQLDAIVKAQQEITPTAESRQQLARDRAELAAMLAHSDKSSPSQKILQFRLDLLSRQSQQNDELDDQATQLQGEIERLTSLRGELAERLNFWNHSRPNQISISLIKPAATDPTPIWPKPLPILAVCMLIGAAVGCISAISIDLLRDRLHDAADAKALTRLPVLGQIPEMPLDFPSPIFRGQCVIVKPSHAAAIACRNVCASLEGLIAAGVDKTILVTGPGNGHGKSTVASNLAITMAKAGHRVALVDANHYRPMVNKIFSVEDTIGLNSAIEGSLSIDEVLHVTALAGLEILPTGNLDEDWTELLNRPEFLMVLTELSERFDRVIIDGGSAQLDESRIISAFCDATILAVDSRRCRRRDLRSAAQGLRAVGAKLTGIALNDVPAHRMSAKSGLPQNAAAMPRRTAAAGHLAKTA